MLRLLLLRHAKSDWADPNLTDHARPLNARGLKAAPKMGAYIASHDMQPALVLCSTATRAQQTKQLVLDQFSQHPEVFDLDSLYSFSSYQNVLNIIRDNAVKQSPLMVIGHNPTLEDLAIALIGSGNSAARARLSQKYPTAALAIIDFDVNSWRELQTGIGIMVDFIRPADL